jgi:SET domain-containing protein
MHLPYDIGISPTLHIRGMIASRLIRRGEVIEACPVVLLPISELPHIHKTELQNYYYDWNKQNISLALGYGSLINHSYTPNTNYRWDYQHHRLIFFAIKDIPAGEEVLTNYNGDPDDSAPLPQGWTSFRKSK